MARVQIERLNVNANYILLNDLLKTDRRKYGIDAKKSIMQLFEFYESNNNLTVDLRIDLAQMAVYYLNTEDGLSILNPLFNLNDSVRDYIMTVGYIHISERGAQDYYNILEELKESMDNNMWCNMFIKDCGIPFQAFDYEPIRKLFCEHCMKENNMILELKKM